MRLLSELESVDRGRKKISPEMPTLMTAGGASTIANLGSPAVT
jgi:hypothetical protein